MGTLERKWGPFGDPKTEKGPYGDPGPQMGTHLGAVQCHFTDFSVEHRGLSRLRLSEFFQFYWVVRRPRPQVPTSRALPWIQRKLGKQYLRNKVTLLRESNPGAVSPTASSVFFLMTFLRYLSQKLAAEASGGAVGKYKRLSSKNTSSWPVQSLWQPERGFGDSCSLESQGWRSPF